MKVPKEQLVEQLHARGQHAVADGVHRDLPPMVDPEEHPDLFGGLDLAAATGDAARHAQAGRWDDVADLPTESEE